MTNFFKLTATALVLGSMLVLSGSAYAAQNSAGAASSASSAQITATGTVLDENGDPLVGVGVLVQGTTQGVITDMDGKFSIQIPAGSVLEFSSLGYKTVAVAVNNSQPVYVNMEPEFDSLNEVVVTALGIKREKKALGYSMEEVKTESLHEIHNESVANMLQGKIAGVQINQSGTGLGGSTRVILRGTTSLAGSNEPLWVVDGMPINNGQVETPNQWGGFDYSGAAAEINPDAIESISVLKGANAAALYGSRAQNGVIIVTTKAGQAGKLRLEYTGNVQAETVMNTYDYQNIYGQGSGGEFDMLASGSWGPKMTGQTVDHWRGINGIYKDSRYPATRTLTPQKDYIQDFYRTGFSATNTITASGGNDKITARFSMSDSRNNDVTPNTSLNKQYFDLNTQFKSKYLDLGIKANYSRQDMTNRVPQGEYGVMTNLVTMPRGMVLADLVDYVGEGGNTVSWAGYSAEHRNPYRDTALENGHKDIRNRLIGKVSAALKFTDWMKLTGRVGIDTYNDDIRNFNLSAQSDADCTYAHSKQETTELDADVMLNIDKRWDDFSISANVGAATTHYKWSTVGVSASNLIISKLAVASNGVTQGVGEYFSEKQINSVLGNATFGYKNMAFIDVTARNDWSSTLPAANRSYFYPSVSLSGILTEIFTLPEQISFWKLRASFAQVGNDTNPYQLESTYSLSTLDGTWRQATVSTTFPLTDLKPEQTNSYEAGTELRMFGGRFGLDFTYYKANTFNQILSVQVPASSGYAYKLINAGEMASKGVELSLNGTIIEKKDFSWNLGVSYGFNRTTCVSLDDNLKQYVLGETRLAKVVVNEGGEYGDIISSAYKRNEAGEILIDDNGLPMKEDLQTVGNMNPKWTGALNTTLNYKNFSLYALVDVRMGGSIISMTDLYACQYGTSARTLTGREDGIVVDGIVESTGEKNTTNVSAQTYWASVASNSGIAEEFTYDASYIKLREISLGYTLPSSVSKACKLESIKISLVGRNLFYIWKASPINPESAFSNAAYAQAFDFTSMPALRNVGLSLNVKF